MSLGEKVSVVVSVYNIEKYIAECLASVINQSYSNLEILCINDGSTDDSLKILSQFEFKDNRVKIINQTNQGLSVSRNTGIKNAQGKYIYFIDGDDFISKDYIKEMVSIINKENTKVVHNPNYLVFYGVDDSRNLKINIHH